MNVEELFEYFRVKRMANLKKRMKRFILTVMLAEEGEIEIFGNECWCLVCYPTTFGKYF